MSDIQIEPDGSNDAGPCSCCGDMSRVVWGYAHDGEATVAAYFVHWTPGAVESHGANFDLVLGRWGADSDARHRFLVALEFRVTEDGPSFMVIDSAGRDSDNPELVGRALSREQVIGTPTADLAFAVVDAIWLQDQRIADVFGST